MKRHGFTLIEVLIVVVVATILFVAAMPSQDAALTQRGRNMAQQLEADIAYAQNMSISDPTNPMLLRVDPVQNKYWLAKHDDDSTPITDRRTGRPFVVTAGGSGKYAGVDIIGVDFNGDDKLGFNGRGTIDQDVDALVQIKSGPVQFEVAISQATGRTRTRTGVSKVIPTDTLAAATGATRNVGDDTGVNARTTDPTGENGAVGSNADDTSLLEEVGNLVKGLLGG